MMLSFPIKAKITATATSTFTIQNIVDRLEELKQMPVSPKTMRETEFLEALLKSEEVVDG